MIYAALIILTILFALIMGGSNFSASFAAVCGSKIISQNKAQILFIICVIMGAILVGKPVAQTIGKNIIPTDFLTPVSVIIIFISVTISLYAANLLRIPQSTSMVTVCAVVGIGIYFKSIYIKTLLYVGIFWIVFPIVAYILTYGIGMLVYPPRKNNLWIYEKLINHSKRLKYFVLFTSCYNAFSVGTNNVANAVGPLSGAGIIAPIAGLAFVAPVFGLGSVFFIQSLQTVSEKIVPLGLLTATIISFVTGSLMIIASVCGVPLSFVMINLASVFAICSLKDGHLCTVKHPITKKASISWLLTPLIALGLSFSITAVYYAVVK
ncbi:MAG: inorganic phosphate transporter [bacterium]